METNKDQTVVATPEKAKPAKKGLGAKMKKKIGKAGQRIINGAVKGAIKGAIKGALIEAGKVAAGVSEDDEEIIIDAEKA